MFNFLLLIITKFIPKGMKLTILKGPLKGLKWIAGAAEGNGKGLSILLNMSEPEQIMKAVQISSIDKIVFDIGANVGMYSILYAKYCKHVYCFEPLPRNIHFLFKVLDINKLSNATIVPFAVGGNFSLANFQKSEKNSEGKINNDGEQPAVIVSIQEFINKYKTIPDILKIDVEGAEYTLLECSKEFLTQSKSLEIILSVHSNKLRNDCLDLLKKCGFDIFEPLNGQSIDNAFEFYIRKY